jgi:hypothetical protein
MGALITNVAVSWSALILHIREVPGSNIGPKSGYPEVLVVFLSPSRLMLEKYFQLGHDIFLP